MRKILIVITAINFFIVVVLGNLIKLNNTLLLISSSLVIIEYLSIRLVLKANNSTNTIPQDKFGIVLSKIYRSKIIFYLSLLLFCIIIISFLLNVANKDKFIFYSWGCLMVLSSFRLFGSIFQAKKNYN
ncbi:hypothetical protein OAQ99_03955 [Candidatus Kapabacteria bacterium]|nr:hypothetical protein [Candidatus Kapabacteria bacterium]